MRAIRVYVDTSVFGGTQDEEFREASQRFFDLAASGRYVVLVSRVTFDELAPAPAEVQHVLRDLPDEAIEEVAVSAEVLELADAYVAAGALGPALMEDAVHVATASVAGADLILSWNFRHIVNYERVRMFHSVNIARGYYPVDIRSPLEVGHGIEDQGV